MVKLTKYIIKFLSIFFPFLRQDESEKLQKYTFEEIDRNSKCYCNSGKKYKKCHLKLNERKRMVALRRYDENGKMDIVECRIKNQNPIKVKNTFSVIEVGLGAR